MANLKSIRLPEVQLTETADKEIVVRLVQDGQQVGGVNVSQIWNNILNSFFAPQPKKPDLRSIR